MFSFSQPLFLLGALAAAIPLALHLMRRHVARDLVFPSIRFIRKGRIPQTGKRRLQDILLLLLRMAAIALLALLLAGPLRKLPAHGGEAGQRHCVVILDVSASMSTEGIPARAVQELKSILSGSSADTVWHLVLSGNGIVDEVAAGTDGRAMLARLRDLRVSTSAGSHNGAVERAIRLLAVPGDRSLYILSDFQASDWEPELLPALPGGIALHLVPLAPGDKNNAAIAHARTVRSVDGGIRVIADVVSYSRLQQERDLTLQVGVDTVTRRLTLPPGQTVQCVFPLEAATSDVGLLRLEPDAYGLDDSYHVWLGAPQPAKLLAVLPTQSDTTGATELFFLRKALSVTAEGANTSYTIDLADVHTFFALNLDSVDGLLLLGAAAYFAEPGFVKVRSFVADGGLVLCTPAAAAPERQIIGLKRNGLLSAQFSAIIGGPDSTRQPQPIGWVDEESRIGRLFADAKDTDLYILTIRRMLALESSDPARDIMRTEDGLPFLVRQDLGTGSFYFFAAPLVSQWSDFPVSMAFLPLVRELFATSPGAQEGGVLRLDCGEGLPLQRGLSGKAALDPESVTWDNSAPDAAPRAARVGQTPVEINVSRKESIPAARSLTALRAALSGGRQVVGDDRQGAAKTKDLRPRVAIILMIVVAAEAALAAYRDGKERHRRVGPPAAVEVDIR